MAEREFKKKPKTQETQPEPVEEGTAKAAGKVALGEELKSELDDLLDEIDEVLEVNAEEFVKGFIQKGGQ